MAKIKNKTTGGIIAEDYTLCTSILSKARGLMFSKRKNLVFAFTHEKIVPLHMLFVFFPISVLFIDKNKKVVEIKENFRPWRFYVPKKEAKYIIELESPLSSRKKPRVGDIIGF